MTSERLLAEIDLSRLAHNLAEVRRRVGPAVAVMGVVKADAYGHGAVPVARELLRLGVRSFCVAAPEEALELRRAGLTDPVLILGGTLADEAEAVLEAQAAVVVSDAETARAFAERAAAQGRVVAVHLKVDTGMGRLGVRAEEAVDLGVRLAAMDGLRLEGVLTHFASADEDADFTERQIALFERICADLAARGVAVPLRHTANSAAVGAHRRSFFNAVRPGITMYGYDPFGLPERTLNTLPLLAVKTRIVLIKQFAPGETIGYGRTYTVRDPLRGAVVPIGYADGLNRLLSNRGEMLVRGRRAPIVGRISMDQAMLDVSRVPGAAVGDEVVVIGEQGSERITADDHARLCDTIPHEILTGLGRRVKRVYLRRGEAPHAADPAREDAAPPGE